MPTWGIYGASDFLVNSRNRFLFFFFSFFFCCLLLMNVCAKFRAHSTPENDDEITFEEGYNSIVTGNNKTQFEEYISTSKIFFLGLNRRYLTNTIVGFRKQGCFFFLPFGSRADLIESYVNDRDSKWQGNEIGYCLVEWTCCTFKNCIPIFRDRIRNIIRSHFHGRCDGPYSHL